MNKRTLFISIFLLLGAGYLAIKLFASDTQEDTATLRRKILYYTSFIAEKMHYSPRAIDDSLSERIFYSYLQQMDGSEDVFLASDIKSLEKYKYSLDEEIRNVAPMEFMPTVSKVYAVRMKEAMDVCKEVLSKPFDYSIQESYINPFLSEQKNAAEGEDDMQPLAPIHAFNSPRSAEERKERWRRKLKSECIVAYNNALESELKKQKDTAYKGNRISLDSLELQARQSVEKRYVRLYERIKKVFDEDQQFGAYVNVIMNLMDPHSLYLSPVDARSYEENTSGKFYGIGALLSNDGSYVKIEALTPGGAAAKSQQVNVNDKILKVAEANDTPTDLIGYEARDAVKFIRGDKGTIVRLTLQKADGRITDISLVREKILINAIFARSGIIPYGNKKMGYIYLPEFYNSADRSDGKSPESSIDIKRELLKLQEQRVDGIIFDLRDNGGGYLLDAVRMAGWFIPKGPIVQVKTKDEPPYILDDKDTSVIYAGPLVVLINERSASASEIFAAAMQDYRRALIVGSRSFGKGTVQKGSIPIADLFRESANMGMMNLTIQKFYRINGKSTQLKGVLPDVVLPSGGDYAHAREKDIPYALPYDSIAQSTYTTYNPLHYNYAEIAKEAQKDIGKSDYYNAIKKYTKILAEAQSKPTPLRLQEFQSETNQREKYYALIDSLSKKVNPIHIRTIKEDSIRYARMDSIDSEWFFEWFKRLDKDPALSYTADILLKLIKERPQNGRKDNPILAQEVRAAGGVKRKEAPKKAR